MKKPLFLLFRAFLFLRNSFYWAVKKPTLGVRGIVVNQKNQILLVKHTYQAGWYLPGGGIKEKESPIKAILREIKEEAGIEALQEPQLFGIYVKHAQGISDYPIVYVIRNFRCCPFRSYEISEIGWFDANSLPEDTSLATMKRLDEFLHQIPLSDEW